jgi:hypothetical protein
MLKFLWFLGDILLKDCTSEAAGLPHFVGPDSSTGVHGFGCRVRGGVAVARLPKQNKNLARVSNIPAT